MTNSGCDIKSVEAKGRPLAVFENIDINYQRYSALFAEVFKAEFKEQFRWSYAKSNIASRAHPFVFSPLEIALSAMDLIHPRKTRNLEAFTVFHGRGIASLNGVLCD